MSTRKRQRVDYTEQSSDEDDVAGKTSKKKTTRPSLKQDASEVEDPDFKGRAPSSRGSRSATTKTPKRPKLNFDYSKVLSLPRDILLLIFEQLQPPILYAISTASPELQELLSSPECRGVWQTCFEAYRVYAPRNFPIQVHHLQGLQQIRGPYRHYAFMLSWDDEADDDDEASPHSGISSLTEGDLEHYQRTYEVPLAVPPCPKDLSEYHYAKKCDWCTNDRPSHLNVFWEFQKRACYSCLHQHKRSFTDLVAQWHNKPEGQEAEKLISFTEFLCYEPYMSLNLTGTIPLLKQRELLFEGDDLVSELLARQQAFSKRREEMPAAEFQEWKASIQQENEDRILAGRKLHEFVCLREMYDRYLTRKESREVAQQKEQLRDRLYTLLEGENLSRDDLHLAQNWCTPFKRLVHNKHVLDIEAGAATRALLTRHAEDIKAWSSENPHFLQIYAGSTLRNCYQERWSRAAHRHLLHELSLADLWLIHASEKFEPIVVDESGLPDRYLLDHEFYHKSARFMEAARFRSLVIREKLLDLLAERKLCEDDQPNNTHSEEDTNEEQDEKMALIKLDHPASLFECKICHTFCDWKAIATHLCVVKDIAYPNYEAYRTNAQQTLCKSVGFQHSRVCAPEAFPAIFKLLTKIIGDVVVGNEWRYEDFKVPETHAHAISNSHKSWLFACAPETCENPRCAAKLPADRYHRPTLARHSFREFMIHLFEICKNNDVDPDDLDETSIRAYAGKRED